MSTIPSHGSSAPVPPTNALQVLDTLRTTWRNIQLPATVNEEDKARIVGSLRIVHDYITSLQADQDRYRESLNNLQVQFEELQQENENLQSNAISLRTNLDRANLTIDRLQGTHSGPTGHNTLPSVTRQQNIPDPEKFSGDRKELKPFLSQVRLKLQGNDAMFPTLSLRLAYIASLVKGPAYAHIEDHISDGFSRIPDVEALLRILSCAFGDPDEVGTAEREIKTLRQKNSDFATYFAEFQRLMTILRWDPRARRATLREGLSTELKDALVFMEEKSELGDFIIQLQNMDNRIRARAQESKASKVRTTTPLIKSSHPAPTKHNEPSFQPGGIVPMALDASRRITPEERQRRMQEGLCAYCAGSGHFARECPNKRPPRLRVAEAVVAPVLSKNESTEE